ncbi:hypothetical protein VitviT2T_025126 [Vitis vinifera]|uniref:FAD-binding FR-type domain-containing protein n=4 Tax=Vitis vinifera TaxID=29760 RepID=A0ABY9DHU3_VITVI|nr:hypothetical protein VitviT2T_025126 [Vitis vinifera]|eukprot:XP_002272804.1 PREDICTED: ferric reduction oxidase 2 [Vitis vinifera]
MDPKVIRGTSSWLGVYALRSVIRLFVMAAFLGYIMVWIMMPTNTFWLHWLPDIHAKTDSKYFGQQGANLLVYTFPVLLIATLGCLYLHLGKKCVDHDIDENSRWALWKRPVLVKGTLGIVSWIELSFLSMFFVLLVWSVSAYLHGMFANITRQSAAKMGVQVWEAKLESAALMLGLVGNICLAFLFFPVTRGSSVLRLIGLTSESSIKYHIWLGHTVMTLFTAHGLCYIIFWAATHQSSELLTWDEIGVSNVAGELALLSGLAMWATSFPHIRQKIFELFFYTHHLYVLFIVFFMLHVGISYSCIMLPGFYLFLIDRYLRFLQSQQRVRLVAARLLPCEAVELNFSKASGLNYTPTSTLFINVPSISKLQWHPFTITSNSNTDPEKVSVVIKSEGSWSSTLYCKLSSPSLIEHLEVSIEGPYGPTSTNFLRHDMLVMVSGGSGITPFISIIRELLFRANRMSSKTPRVLLVSAFKKSLDVAMLDLLLPVSGTTSDISQLQLQIEVYVTRETEPTRENQKLLRTIWFNFKPNTLDVPVSAILGPNSWLWLGTIMSSSFVIFLLIIGILTRYYIQPIDHNTNMIYSYSARSALNMLLMCVSISMPATAAFLWNKKQATKEMRQIQNTAAPTPTTSPGSWFYNADRELEAFPHQSFVEATKVHYGERPNLRRIISECAGSSVGVLVSGPRKMRQEVAAICSSGLADNLHFESISFNW